MPASNRTACSATVMPTDARQNARLARYIYSDDFTSQKRLPAHAGLMARSPVGAPVAEWPSRLSQNERGTHFSPPAAKRQKQTPHIGRTAPLTTAESHLKHGTSRHGCYNDNILHPAPGKTGPLNFPDGHSAWPPAMRLNIHAPRVRTCAPIVPAARDKMPCGLQASCAYAHRSP